MNITCSAAHGDFEWDSDKEEVNRRKHGIGFALAVEAFADVHGLYRMDTVHSIGEERLQLIGQVSGVVLLEQICIEIVFNFNAGAPLTLRKKRGFSLGSGAGSRSRGYQNNPTFSMWNCSIGCLY